MNTLWQLFLTFFKIGSVTFGGGLAMLPLIQHEATRRHGWMNEEEITECFAVSQSLPGVLAINSAIYIGYRVRGVRGAVAAALGVILPAYLSILAVMFFLSALDQNPSVQGALEGIKASAVALILVTVWTMGRKILSKGLDWVVAILSFLIIVVLGYSAIWAILLGGMAGFLSDRARRRQA